MNNEKFERGEPGIDRRRVAEGKNLTDHDLFFYQWYLKFSIEEYKGGKILDVGSGFSETFSREASEKGVEVVSLNPALAKEADRKIRDQRMAEGDNIEAVAGLVQELPFGENSFDAVTALFSVPRFLEDKIVEYQDTFSEMVRVVKPGGKVYVFPIDREKVEGQHVVSLVSGLEGVERVESYLEEDSSGHNKQGIIITKEK